jgi:hypothetical protein
MNLVAQEVVSRSPRQRGDAKLAALAEAALADRAVTEETLLEICDDNES